MNDFAPFAKFNDLIYALILLYKPETVVELGTGEGNCMALIGIALKMNRSGKLFSFDVYGERIQGFLPKTGKTVSGKKRMLGLERVIENIQTDIFNFSWIGNPIDLLVIDIDNTFERLKKIADNWFEKLSPNGIILFEGGFSQYNKSPRGVFEFCNYLHGENWETFTLMHYPGLVLARRIQKDDQYY
jgi:tRNA A58 N-methylase Trm61